MNNGLIAATTFLCIAAAMPAVALAGPELIENGTFAGGSAQGWSATINGTNGQQDAVEINPSAVYGLAPYHGNLFNLEVNANAIDTVETLVTGLVIGETYALSWGYGNRGGGGAQAVDVSFGSTFLVEDSYDGHTAPDTWSTNEFLVKATATSEYLVFASLDEGGSPSYGNEISDVSLIPEPAAAAMFAVGIAGLGLLRRRSI